MTRQLGALCAGKGQITLFLSLVQGKCHSPSGGHLEAAARAAGGEQCYCQFTGTGEEREAWSTDMPL